MIGRHDPKEAARSEGVPRGVWALGLVSLMMDVSSEMIHALLPVFLTLALGAGALSVGAIEGIGEATAALIKPVSGRLSDRLGRRKGLAVFGYALGALSKPIFALAPSVAWVLFARFSDRVGKGIRGAPRDALVADLTPPELRGRAFGLRQALDTVGAFAGPLLAMILMGLSSDDFRLVFGVAVVPGFMAVGLLFWGVREPAALPRGTPRGAPQASWRLGALGASFWGLAAVGSVLTLARFSEAFLVLRAQGLGLSLTLVPLVLVAMNLVYAATAYPAGYLADRIDRRVPLAAGFVILIASDLVLAHATGLGLAFLGIGLWGLHLGLTQGLLAAMVADAAPTHLRGTAFGVFHLLAGGAVLIASVVAGALWQWQGPQAAFIVGAALATLGLVGIATLSVRPGTPQ